MPVLSLVNEVSFVMLFVNFQINVFNSCVDASEDRGIVRGKCFGLISAIGQKSSIVLRQLSMLRLIAILRYTMRMVMHMKIPPQMLRVRPSIPEASLKGS